MEGVEVKSSGWSGRSLGGAGRLSLKLFQDDLSSLFGQGLRALACEMDIAGALQFGAILHKFPVVVDRDLQFAHHPLGGLVVANLVASGAETGSDRNGGRISPDELGVCLLEPLDDGAEILFVFFHRDVVLSQLGGRNGLPFLVELLQVVKPKVEVNEIPRRVAEPLVEILKAIDRGMSILG